jgi:hypothetical protein
MGYPSDGGQPTGRAELKLERTLLPSDDQPVAEWPTDLAQLKLKTTMLLPSDDQPVTEQPSDLAQLKLKTTLLPSGDPPVAQQPSDLAELKLKLQTDPLPSG